MAITFTWNNPNTNEYTPEFTVIYRSETQFEADDLPDPLIEMPGAEVSYNDETAVDGVTYYYRVSFKLGIKEMVSRLIEITAPTTPDFYSTITAKSVTSWSQYTGYGLTLSDMAIAVDDFNESKWVTFAGEPALAGGFFTYGEQIVESLIVRLAAMVAIQKFRRNVLLNEGFTRQLPSTIVTITDTSNTTGWNNSNYAFDFPAGTKFTWQEAFNFIARSHTSMDICLNVFNELKNDILISFTSSRGQIPAKYNIYQTVAVMMDYVLGLGQVRGPGQPFKGFGTWATGTTFSLVNQVDRSYLLDGMPFIRLVRAIFTQYPEIKDAFRITDQGANLTYRDASDNVIDFFSVVAQGRNNADPINNMVISTSAVDVGTGMISARERNMNGNVQMAPDSYGMCSISRGTSNTNGWAPVSFFLTTTANGKDFASFIANGCCPTRANFDHGAFWNKASAYAETWTEGLTTTDPMESQVLLRYIPSLGLVDQSSRGTTLEFLGGGLNFAQHSSALHASPGFPDLALQMRSTSPAASLGTLKTNLNMMDYVRSNTAFTIEMFISTAWAAGNWQNRYCDLISLGGYASGFRYTGVCAHLGWAYFGMNTFTSHTAAIARPSRSNTRGWSAYTESDFNNANGNQHFYHIALQYDPILARFELFVNGIMTDFWTQFTPTATGMFLSFFGMLNNATDQTTSRQYDFNAHMDGNLLIHEIVVTRAKRYNYANFIGKVPFARKRFAA